MGFYISLFIFIFALITGLVLTIAGKGMRRDRFLLLSSIHMIFLFAFIASIILTKSVDANQKNYFFTAFICSGIILSGVSWRSFAPFALKIYFSAFLLTLPLFLVSPSMLLNFLVTTHYSASNGPVYMLTERYLLEKQDSGNDSIFIYKMTLKKGMFHQTIRRDIDFGGKLDSVKVVEMKNDSMHIRGYSGKATFVSADVDSVDVIINLVTEKRGDVEYKL